MALTPYEDLPGVALELPINGRTYRILPMGVGTVAKLTTAIESDDAGPVTDAEFVELALGGTLAEMREHNVPTPAINLAAMVALTDAQHGRLVAEAMWNATGNGIAAGALLKSMATSVQAAAAAAAAVDDEQQAAKPSTKTPRKRTAAKPRKP